MERDDFQYPTSKCDVPIERQPSLEAYRAKRRLWVSWLDGDEYHAIWTAISAMVWTDISFRTLSKIAIDNPGTSLGNSLLAEQLINGHVATQVLGIRRLLDNRRDVISLRRLIKDVRSNFELFTRENYVCFDGLPYDYKVVMQRELQEHAKQGPFWAATSGPDAWGISRMAHVQFDRLASIDPSNRQREDRLPTALLDKIEDWLDQSGADELADWSHAYLAHAGGAESRKRIAAAQITNNKITDAIRAIARVTEAMSAYILYAGGRTNALMPTAQFNQFENLDQPAMPAEFLQIASDAWDRLSDERDAFLEGVREELVLDKG